MALLGLCQHSFFLVIEKLRSNQLKYQLFPQKKRLAHFYITSPFCIFAKKYAITKNI